MNNKHIAHMLRHRAQQYQKKTVFLHRDGDRKISTSWSSFLNDADQVSKFLLSVGVQKSDNIGIFSSNTPEWNIVDLGVLSVAAVVIPMYSTATLPHIQYISEETEMKIIFVYDDRQLSIARQIMNMETSLLECIVTFNCEACDDSRVIQFSDLLTLDLSNYSENLTLRLSMCKTSDLATIIYTSGTTGEPKGAMLTHRTFLQGFKNHEERLTVQEDDISLCFLPLSHVFERSWTYFLLYSGGVNAYCTNPREIMEYLKFMKPTLACVVPRFFEKVYDGIKSDQRSWSFAKKTVFNWALNVGYRSIKYQSQNKPLPKVLSTQRSIANTLVFSKIHDIFGGNIRTFFCSGAAMSIELRKYFHALGVFVNYGYGATETLATVSCMRSDYYDFDYTGSIMPNVEVKISDDNMILVKGETVFAGYYKKPEETAEVLKDGWFHTGDQGTIPEPGILHMTERIKDIMKTSTGKYISPQKIEMVHSQSGLIDQMCVFGDNRKFLSALIVPSHEKLNEIAKRYQIDHLDHSNLLQHDKIQEFFDDELSKTQSQLPSHEKIVKYKLLEEPFSIDNEMMTNSMKVRRKKVYEAYADLIQSFYNESVV